jgi:starch-binding outer membrane protein, SusD/RagB family
MKRKIIYLGIATVMLLASCKDYLDVTSDSKFTSDFVFSNAYEANKAVLGAYEILRGSTGIHSNGLWYDQIAVQSDIECPPEVPTYGGRYSPENMYNTTVQLSDAPGGSWNSLYTLINRCNIIIDAFETNPVFVAADKTTPSDLVHLYGETVALRATAYFELTRCWGDVIYSIKPIQSKADYEGLSLTDRSTVQEKEIANLISVEPMMYKLNTGGAGTTAERMTREYVQGLIGRMALLRGGYSLRPAEYTGDGTVIQTHPVWGKMVRRSDWLDYYTIANTYLKKLVNEGNAILVTADTRTPVAKFSNPFQLVFQKLMDNQISTESIYEVPEMAGVSTERPYAFGRPSDGGSPAYPPKAYGQIRFFPTFYYGMYNPKDLRRDVTVAVTALSGVASEKIMSFKKGNKSQGGLALNKFDYCRITDKTYATTQRQTGINAPYMRLDDMILLLAETYSVLSDDPNARAQLLKIRQRSFNSADPEYTALTTTYVNSLSGAALLAAIQDERAMEMAGEGQRKYDLVRWGLLGKKINDLQTQMGAMITGLQTSGSYTFANGNTIRKYIYTKVMDKATLATMGLTDLLTYSCNVTSTDPLYPVLWPAWRGTFTEWTAPATVTLAKTDLAIQGLFGLPADTVAIKTAGYARTRWGIDLISDVWRPVAIGIFGGYLPDSYAAGYPPRYILAIPAATITYSNGAITNSYGFPNQ